MRRFAPPLLLVVAILAAAPFLGLLRDALLARFEKRTLFLLLIGLTAATAVVLAARIARLGQGRRLGGMAGLALVAVLVGLQQGFLRTGIPSVDLVEAIHLFEYGLLALLLDRALRRRGTTDVGDFAVPVLLTLAAGVLDETVQALAPQRVGDLRDVALDAFGGLCGMVVAFSLDPPVGFRWRPGPSSRRGMLRAVAVAVALTGSFTAWAHLGHEIADPEVGSFLSHVPRERLLEAAAERARTWAEDPPTELPVLGIEDRYLTEAAWHANHRNASLGSGDLGRAWAANRILELYYAPFLDLESFRGAGRHRWPPEVRERVENERPPHDPARYASPVLRERLRAWPRRPLLAGSLLFALALAALAERGRPAREEAVVRPDGGA